MPAALHATSDLARVEAPVTWKGYALVSFASVGGIFYGYDSGYISGVLGMTYFIDLIDPGQTVLSAWKKSLITSILSAGTCVGCVIAGDLADWIGRRTTIIAGCVVYIIGCILQTAASGLVLLVVGRVIAGIGVGFVSSIIILYMSELAPKAVRGAIVSGYQFCITIGLLIASCVDYATEHRTDSGSYRIPIAIQFLWGLILGIGLLFLPDTPRYWVMKGKLDKATKALARTRDQPEDSEYIQDELSEVIANLEYERSLMPNTSYIGQWTQCFKGPWRHGGSNGRLVVFGMTLQMMQQLTGVNFVFYFGTTFFQQLGTISNSFLISLITTLVNVCSTPVSFWTVERFGRRPLLIYGAIGMFVCELIVAAVGTALPGNVTATKAMIAFICIYIFFFASTWGPGAWVLIGEVFPIPIRSKGVALSTAGNFIANTIITVITPYLVDTDKANLGAKVFWIWTATCGLCFVYAYFLVPETKNLTLEQVNLMLETTSPRKTPGWTAPSTFASQVGITADGELKPKLVEEIEKTESHSHV